MFSLFETTLPTVNFFFFIFWTFRSCLLSVYPLFIFRNIYSFKFFTTLTPCSFLCTLLVCLLVWGSFSWLDSLFFFSHFFFSCDSAGLFRFFILFTVLGFLFLVNTDLLSSSCLSKDSALFLVLSYLTFLLTPGCFFLLFLTTNIFTAVVLLECLALLSLTFLLYSPSRFPAHLLFRGFVFFFWVNASTSLLLFALVMFSADAGIVLNFVFSSLGSKSFEPGALSSQITLSFILLTLLFKLGLPPLVLWKITVFNLTPSSFIGYYSAYFFPPLLIFFVHLAEVFIYHTDFNSSSFTSALYLALLTSVFFALSLSFFSNTFGSFFAISGALTTLLFFLISFSTPHVPNPAAFLGLLGYAAAYGLTLLSTFRSLCVAGFAAGYQHLGCAPLLRLGAFLGVNALRTFLSIMIFLFSLFAGLPPFITFYVKLYVVSYLVNYNLGLWWLSLFVLFLFVLLYFYFKNARFMLTQDVHSLNLRLSTPGTSKLRDIFFYNSYSIGVWHFSHVLLLLILFWGFALLADLFLVLI